jgi:putative transposase
MEAHQDEHSIVKMCSVLQVSTSGFYKWKAKLRSGKTEREKQKADLKKKISQSFHASLATYGSPRVHQDLIAWGYMVSQKTVARYMQEMEVSAKPKAKYVVTTDSTHALHVYPNLLKRVFQTAYPNAIWVADITYVRTLEGWLYVASIMDLFSRKIVGLNMSTSMEKDLVLHALERAIVTRRPPEGLIHHSDRGSQYCSNEYIEALTQAKATISMSRKGDP